MNAKRTALSLFVAAFLLQMQALPHSLSIPRLLQNAPLGNARGLSAVAAATENDNDCKDYNPSTVVVKEMAKAIVIHVCLPPGVTCGFFLPLSIILCPGQNFVNRN